MALTGPGVARTAHCVALFVATVGTLAVVSGCSAAADDPSDAPTSNAFTDLVDGYLASGEAQSYSDEQVAALTSARANGELTFEAYAEAIDITLQCISDAGFYTEKYPVDKSRGFPTVGYFYESPDSGNPVAEACRVENSSAIESVYQLQPTSTEAEEAVLQDDLVELTECMTNKGVVTEPGLEGRELYGAYTKLLIEEVDQGVEGPVTECFMSTPG